MHHAGSQLLRMPKECTRVIVGGSKKALFFNRLVFGFS